jgi:uncharacterized protein (TIGR00661 family)
MKADKKILFTIQGEGRGHMTQAIALKSILEQNGYTICAVLIGASKRRVIPEFVIKKFAGIPLIKIPSPNFVLKDNKGIDLFKTVVHNAREFSTYRRSARILGDLVSFHRPDVIINFYEPITALYASKHAVSNRPPIISIAHQYLNKHEHYKHPPGHFLDRLFLKAYTNFTAKGSSKLLGLSIYPLPPAKQSSRLVVVPPLLRGEIKHLTAAREDFLLCYTVNPGYREDLINWHRDNPDTELHIFTDLDGSHDTISVRPNLTLHRLNDVKFLEFMSRCKALVSTAGFESICEAHYLNKKCFMVPVEGHFEQLCNAFDAASAGVGLKGDNFNLTPFLKWLSLQQPSNGGFRDWENQAGAMILSQLDKELLQQSITPQLIPA